MPRARWCRAASLLGYEPAPPALRNLGMETFRLFLPAQDRMDQGATKGGGLETIAYYLERYSSGIIDRKKAVMPATCPLRREAAVLGAAP